MSVAEHADPAAPRSASRPPGARTPVALTLAGSDSGGGAGIQADLKAFAACGVHGTCAITAITAQDTAGVRDLHPLPPDLVLVQARAVIADIGVDAVKVGMLATEPVARAVAELLEELPDETPVVVDPVIAASSGALLLDQQALRILTQRIMRRATVITPNVPEARTLVQWSGGAGVAGGGAGEGTDGGSANGVRRGDEDAQARALLRALGALGAHAVVLTGGHRERPTDLFWEALEPDAIVEITGERHASGAEHGSGCTHSAVLAAELAKGAPPLAAARRARELAARAIAGGHAELGSGSGPVDVLACAERKL